MNLEKLDLIFTIAIAILLFISLILMLTALALMITGGIEC